jgi:hypothetical protein
MIFTVVVTEQTVKTYRVKSDERDHDEVVRAVTHYAWDEDIVTRVSEEEVTTYSVKAADEVDR